MTVREPERPDAWTPTDRRGAPSRPAHVGDVWQAVPRSLRVGAAVGVCLLVVAAALYVIGLVVAYLAAIVVPVAVALLLAALLAPAVGYLVKRVVRRGSRPRSYWWEVWPVWAESSPSSSSPSSTDCPHCSPNSPRASRPSPGGSPKARCS
jgi:hypothetical protein